MRKSPKGGRNIEGRATWKKEIAKDYLEKKGDILEKLRHKEGKFY